MPEKPTGIKLTDRSSQIKQMEFLLGETLPENIASEVGHLSHLTIGNEWVMKVLEAMGKTVNDIKFEEDREVLRNEYKDTKYGNLCNMN